MGLSGRRSCDVAGGGAHNAVAAAHDDEADVGASSHGERKSDAAENIDDEYDGSISEGSLDVDEEEILGLFT